jgi:hypothetical protein
LIVAVFVAPSLSDVPYLRDLHFDVAGLYMSAYMLAAQAAQNLGLGQLAVQPAYRALAFHTNPVKMHHAHAKLGEILILGVVEKE